MEKFYLLIICIISSISGQAQFKKDFAFGNRKYSVQYFDSNIIRITHYYAAETKRENISDAVILKPLAKASKYQAALVEDALVIPFRNGEIVINSDSVKRLNFRLRNNEKIFGGGERALSLNRRGYRLTLYNNPWYGYSEGADNLNYSVPFLTSSLGYGLFFDNPSKGYVDIGKTKDDVLEYSTLSGEVVVYIIFGDYKTILQSYHKLTGKQPLPPRWALGNLMSRFGYTSEAQVKSIYQKMKEEGVPVDAVIFDLFWFGDSIKGTMGNLEWVNKNAWPDPRKMIAGFKKEDVQTILVTEPFFVETAKNYTASKPYLAVDSLRKPYYLTDFYFGKGGLIDIFRKDAQSWFWQFYKKQMQNGVEAWWGDLGEPEKHPANMYHNLRDLGHMRLFSADEVHNLYGHTWTKMLNNFYAKEYPNKRLFSLNRAGFAGSPRYSIFPWTGDVSRSWEGLRAQLPILLGMSMSGVPYVHSDAGGFAGGEGDLELYVRWLQFAAFTPVFRPHGTALYEVEPAAFSFPSEAALIDMPYRNYAKKAIYDRYRLLPYNYNLAYQQARYGKPLMAPMFYYFSSDTSTFSIQDQYMWGESLMVVPVLEKGAVSRSYYIPAGKWYHMKSWQMLEGGRWEKENLGLDGMPLLAKEGSFIPVNSGMETQNTSKYRSDSVSVIYVPSEKPSAYEMFFDDGVTKGSIEKGLYELITVKSSGVMPRLLEWKISSNKGRYSGKPVKRHMQFWIPQTTKPATLKINGRNMSLKKMIHEYGNGIILEFEFTGMPVNIKMQW